MSDYKDFIIDNDVLTKYTGTDSAVTIPAVVTAIGANAFAGCDHLVSVTIPDSVTLIGHHAFCGCSNLISVVIPEGVPMIGDWTFYECINLRSITIPSSVEYIYSEAFCRCVSLTSVTIPDRVKIIGHGAFYECVNLRTINFPKSLELIADEAFHKCASLRRIEAKCSLEIIHPPKLQRIATFEGSQQQSKRANPASRAEFEVKQVNKKTGVIVGYNGQAAEPIWPQNCDHLQIVGICIEKKTKNLKRIESLVLPEGYQKVGGFSGCTALKKVVLPESLVTIQKRAFADCASLDEVVVHDNVFHMGNEAFAGCTSLAEFTLPARWQSADEGEILRNIGKRVFKDSGIRKLYVNSAHLDPKDSDILKNCRNYVIYAPKESPFFEDRLYKGYTQAYTPDSLSKLYSIVVQNNLGQESYYLLFNREKNALERITANIYLTAAGLQERQNVWSLVAEGTDIKALNEQGVIMGHIRYKKDIEEMMNRYCGRIENFRFCNKEWNWSERNVREYLEAICMFDIVLENPISGSIDTERTINCAKTSILSGKTFVVTGDLYHYASRDVLKELIEAQGGKLTGSVSSKTTALITNFPDSSTTKIKKAQELGIEIVTEEEFIRRYLSE